MSNLLFYAALPWIVSWAAVGVAGLGCLISSRLRATIDNSLFQRIPDTQIEDEDDQADLERVLQADRQRYIAGERPLLLQ